MLGKADEKRIKALESELKRKEKALAETAALLVLQKKAQAIWGGRRGRMIKTPDRRRTVELIKEAVNAGASCKAACEWLKISPRTYRRWTQADDIKTDGRVNAKRPARVNGHLN